jgi:hypothetical protein
MDKTNYKYFQVKCLKEELTVLQDTQLQGMFDHKLKTVIALEFWNIHPGKQNPFYNTVLK